VYGQRAGGIQACGPIVHQRRAIAANQNLYVAGFGRAVNFKP
jgi:hypothetical protein